MQERESNPFSRGILQRSFSNIHKNTMDLFNTQYGAGIADGDGVSNAAAGGPTACFDLFTSESPNDSVVEG